MPIIFNAPGALTVTGHEIWCAVSGGANWGGCDVWASMDDAAFKFIGRLFGASRYGVLTAPFPIASPPDPDTINTCSVDLSISSGVLLSGTQADADNLITPCLVGDEIIAYKTAILGAAAYNYDLKDYIRRGCYGTTIVSHQSPYPRFVRLDNSLFKYPYDPALIGQTIYLKFLSFNKYNGGLQSLSDVSSYPYVIGSSLSYPSNVGGFSVSQTGASLVFSWNALVDLNLAGYEIRYGALSSPIVTWAAATPITTKQAGTSFTIANIAAGSYTFLICAQDKSGNYSKTAATYNLVVTSYTPILDIASSIHGATTKATPADADEVGYIDTESNPPNTLKKATWANIKAFLKTYFDSLYVGGGGATKALDNLDSVAINASLVPDTDNTCDLGASSSPAKRWKDLFLAGVLNGLTLAAQAVGFTIAGGTTSKTLMVGDDATISGTNSGDETASTLGSKMAGATAKATPVDADIVGFADTQSSPANILKSLTWTNVKAFLKTYFDGLYLTDAASDGNVYGRKNAAWSSISVGSAHVIQDETTPKTQRANLNFTGAGVTATDNAGTDSTDVTIPGGGIGGGDGWLISQIFS